MNTTEEKRNSGKEKKKENKKFPYKKCRKNKKGGIGDVFGAISFFVIGFFLGHFFGQKLMDMFIQMIRRLITNGFSGSV